MQRPPPYVSPKEVAENRARMRRFFYGLAVTVPAVMMLMALGYSDQAPAWLRTATEKIDAVFFYPVLRLIAFLAG